MRTTLQNNDLRIGLRAKRRRTKATRVLRRVTLGTISTIGGVILAGYGIGFLTRWGNTIRMDLAETIHATRHAYLAHLITTPAEYSKLNVSLFSGSVVQTNIASIQVKANATHHGTVTYEPISGPGYNGYVMFVYNPRLIRLVAAKVSGAMGEYITKIAPRVGAVAGINASGFEDPNGNGWGGIPVGLEYVGGRLINWPLVGGNWATVGFTSNGTMVLGQYSLAQLKSLRVRDAMQFHPELVVNGKPLITNGDGGWGWDSRTAIGQRKEDGTVIFIAINGRGRNSSIGATQRDMQDLMLRYGAWNACAMDGGSSSVLFDANANPKILTVSSSIDPNGERHLPDAWLVFPEESVANGYTP